MPIPLTKWNWKRSIRTCVALAALANGGCLGLAIGAAAGGAGLACTTYCRGKVCSIYPSDPNNTLAAVKTALMDLAFPLESVENGVDKIVVHSHTGDGDPIRIELIKENPRIPAEGSMTRVGVRVASFGDRPLSERIHYQIGLHLAPGTKPSSSLPPVASAAPTFGPPQPPGSASPNIVATSNPTATQTIRQSGEPPLAR